ncbi:MAG TPA: Ig-like domain repeat protein, partial [Jatrophihabitans sp.]|nr:Ig-like domain repeat protein [Jatrophihabitans sp.]
DIMNTADQDVFTGLNHTGDTYAPERVGAGRIDAQAAAANDVLAYNADDHGAVSVSFGPIEATGSATITRSKTITVDNTGESTATYDVSYDPRTNIPGATYQVSPSTVSVDGGQKATLTVTLTIDPTQLTKTIDPTVSRLQGAHPRVYQADASGLVLLASTSGGTDLRVPVYSAPRPASTMTQPTSLTMPHGATASANLTLSGSSFDQGSGREKTQALVAGFELTAKSGALPNCGMTRVTGCIAFPDEKAADIRYVGVTSDNYQLAQAGVDATKDGSTYFAITTQGPWRTPSSSQEFDVFIDTNGDGNPDYDLFTSRLSTSTDTDVLVSQLLNLNTGVLMTEAPLNAALGNTDTALLNSDTLVMQVHNAHLKLPSPNARFHYAVASFSPYQGDAFDLAGVDSRGNLALSFAPARPGLAVFGSVTAQTSPLLFHDTPGADLAVRRIAGSYSADKAQGALMVHFHNVERNKAQVVTMPTQSSSTSLRLSPNPDTVGQQMSATVTVSGASGPTSGGTVTLKYASGATVGHATLVNGKATIRFRPTSVGTFKYVASYGGDAVYSPSSSGLASEAVWKISPRVGSHYSARTVRVHHTLLVGITVPKVNGIAPSGRVFLMQLRPNRPALPVAQAMLSGGRATLHFAPPHLGQIRFRAYYGGDSHYRGGSGVIVTITITS